MDKKQKINKTEIIKNIALILICIFLIGVLGSMIYKINISPRESNHPTTRISFDENGNAISYVEEGYNTNNEIETLKNINQMQGTLISVLAIMVGIFGVFFPMYTNRKSEEAIKRAEEKEKEMKKSLEEMNTQIEKVKKTNIINLSYMEIDNFLTYIPDKALKPEEVIKKIKKVQKLEELIIDKNEINDDFVEYIIRSINLRRKLNLSLERFKYDECNKYRIEMYKLINKVIQNDKIETNKNHYWIFWAEDDLEKNKNENHTDKIKLENEIKEMIRYIVENWDSYFYEDIEYKGFNIDIDIILMCYEVMYNEDEIVREIQSLKEETITKNLLLARYTDVKEEMEKYFKKALDATKNDIQKEMVKVNICHIKK